MRQLNIVRGRSPQSDVEKKRTRRDTNGGMRDMVPKSFSFSDAFFQYSNGRIFSGSERLYITGETRKFDLVMNCSILYVLKRFWQHNEIFDIIFKILNRVTFRTNGGKTQ